MDGDAAVPAAVDGDAVPAGAHGHVRPALPALLPAEPPPAAAAAAAAVPAAKAISAAAASESVLRRRR